jgi:ribonucleoside-diphosphate reductase alpha chain
MFLDDTACNLASLNLMQFRLADGSFDVASFEHACRLWTVVLEISVLMAQFPSSRDRGTVLPLSHARPGLRQHRRPADGVGLSYDSDEGRALCGAISAVMTGTAYATSAEMAGDSGRSRAISKTRSDMLRVIRNHRRAAYGETMGYEKLATPPVPLDHPNLPGQAAVRRRNAASGTRLSNSVTATATATPRPPSSRRPARSVSSWTATRRASSRTSPW